MRSHWKWMSVFLICLAASLFSKQASWKVFKNETIDLMETVPGWCSNEKALLMMDVIKENKCKCCVEIGVFSGKSLLPIAKALQYNKKGTVCAIDAWDPSEVVKGFNPSDSDYTWWGKQDFNLFYDNTSKLIKNNKLNKFCVLVKATSHVASYQFDNETIDFIHFDGNHNEEFAFQDILDYYPKVKNGGFILLNDPNWKSLKLSLVFLLERADLISPFSPSAAYFLFRKNIQREENANILMIYE